MNQFVIFSLSGVALYGAIFHYLRLHWMFWRPLTLKKWSHLQHVIGMSTSLFVTIYLGYTYIVFVFQLYQQLRSQGSYRSFYIPEYYQQLFGIVRLFIYIVGLIGLVVYRKRSVYYGSVCYVISACLMTTPIANLISLVLLMQGSWLLRPITDND